MYGLCLRALFGGWRTSSPTILHSSYAKLILKLFFRPVGAKDSSILFQWLTCIYPSLHLAKHYSGIQKSSHVLSRDSCFLCSSIISVKYDSFLVMQTVTSARMSTADNFWVEFISKKVKSPIAGQILKFIMWAPITVRNRHLLRVSHPDSFGGSCLCLPAGSQGSLTSSLRLTDNCSGCS